MKQCENTPLPWTTAADLKKILHRKWQQGLFLKAYFTDEPLFPLRVPIKHPNAKELGSMFAAAKEWLHKLETHIRPKESPGYELEYRQINHRQLGRQTMPIAAIFQRQKDALAIIGKIGEAEKFIRLVDDILAAHPKLILWLQKRPLKVLEHENEWLRLLEILAFLRYNPWPGIYLRQLDIAGVDTKFIEKRKKILTELLDLVLAPQEIDQEAKGIANFEQRYGFTAKPIQIRFRILDKNLYINALSDLQIPAAEFANLNLAVERVFITENIINGLAFPDFPKAIVIFGLGYGIDRLAAINWLKDKKISYWGDLDSHGFAMLDQMRSYFPQTSSLLMDRNTLMAHQQQWGFEKSPTCKELPRLNLEENQLYNEIRDNRLANGLRLEQERISYQFLTDSLRTLSR